MNVVIHSWSQYAACRVRFLQGGGGGGGRGGGGKLPAGSRSDCVGGKEEVDTNVAGPG